MLLRQGSPMPPRARCQLGRSQRVDIVLSATARPPMGCRASKSHNHVTFVHGRCGARRVAGGVMRDLQPLAAYEQSAGPSFLRATVVLALLWAIPMTMFMMRTNQGSPGFVITVAAVGGLLFGGLVTMLARFATRQLTQVVYHCVWPIVPAAPPGEYDARLMCRLKRGRMAVGGHLYVGNEGWVFVPHTRNGPLYRKPVRWERPAGFSLSTQRPRWGWLSWLFGLGRDDQLVLADGANRAVFTVPNAADVVAALNARV